MNIMEQAYNSRAGKALLGLAVATALGTAIYKGCGEDLGLYGPQVDKKKELAMETIPTESIDSKVNK